MCATAAPMIGRAYHRDDVPSSSSGPRWPNTYVARLQAVALLQTLNAEILASASATRALEAWCRTHQLEDEPRVVIERVPSQPRPWRPEHEQWLSPRLGEKVTHRRVQLRCGPRILAEADNWYLGSRLTPEINRVLDTTNTPFGTAIASLDPYRRTIAVRLMWAPLSAWWDDGIDLSSEAPTLPIPESLFEHRTVLYTREQTAVSFVEERYKRSLLPARLDREDEASADRAAASASAR